MNDILDEIDKPNFKKTFSILSFGFSLATTILIVYILFLSPSTIKISDLTAQMRLINISKMSCLLGIIFTTISYVKNEPKNKLKSIGTVLNGTMFAIIVLAVIFRFVIDYIK